MQTICDWKWIFFLHYINSVKWNDVKWGQYILHGANFDISIILEGPQEQAVRRENQSRNSGIMLHTIWGALTAQQKWDITDAVLGTLAIIYHSMEKFVVKYHYSVNENRLINLLTAQMVSHQRMTVEEAMTKCAVWLMTVRDVRIRQAMQAIAKGSRRQYSSASWN